MRMGKRCSARTSCWSPARAECRPSLITQLTRHTVVQSRTLLLDELDPSSRRSPHTGAIITARVVLAFTDQRFRGRRVWWTCPQCPRRVRFLYGGRAHISQPGLHVDNEVKPVRLFDRELGRIGAL